MDPDDIKNAVSIIIGVGGLGALLKAWFDGSIGRKKQDTDGLLSLIHELQEDNKVLRADNDRLRDQIELTRKEASRANRRIDLILRAVRSCPNGAQCPALVMDTEEVEDAGHTLGT